jgi:hypothetical protein
MAHDPNHDTDVAWTPDDSDAAALAMWHDDLARENRDRIDGLLLTVAPDGTILDFEVV